MVMMVISALLTDENVGLSNHDVGPHRYLGWFSYFMIEAYGSLMVALFWSFTNSIMDLEQAKGAYGLIISIAQVGAIAGSTLAVNAKDIGISQLFLIGAVMIFSVCLLIKTYHLAFRDHVTESVKERVRSISESTDTASLLMGEAEEEAVSPRSVGKLSLLNPNHKVAPPRPSLWLSVSRIFGGFYEGLSLVLRHGYIVKLLGVSCLYEVVVTVLDYQFKILGAHSVSRHIESLASHGDQFANLLGHFGQVTNLLSFCVSFFGFSYFVHQIGVPKSLLIFPVLLFVAVVIINLVPSLWVLFVFVSVIKALIFSLHDPVKELLYIPTSDAIKFKAKAWVDVFGSRLAKAAGSLLTSLAAGNAATLRSTAEIPCLVLSAIIIFLAWSIGRDFEGLIASNTVVGDEHAHLSSLGGAGQDIQRGLPVVGGLQPGEVGYTGYDLHLFEGVFDSSDEDEGSARNSSKKHSQSSSSSSRRSQRQSDAQQRNYAAMRSFEFPRMNSSSNNADSVGEFYTVPLPPANSSSRSSAFLSDSPDSKRTRARSAQI